MPEILYHYCSGTTFASIINGKCLRLCDIRKSNDEKEMSFLYPQLFNEMKAYYNSLEADCQFYEISGYEGFSFFIDKVKNDLDKKIEDGNFTSFVACFCEKGNVLSQWRAYGDDGRGFSIGFSKSALERYCSTYNDVIKLVKVRYADDKEKKNIIEGEAIKLVNKIIDIYNSLSNTEEYQSAFTQYCAAILIENSICDSLRFKSKAFEEEQEWRLYFTNRVELDGRMVAEKKEFSSINPYETALLPILQTKIDHNVTADDMVAFYPITFDELGDQCIKKIYRGPKNKSNFTDIELLLANRKLLKEEYDRKSNRFVKSIDISISNISYR